MTPELSSFLAQAVSSLAGALAGAGTAFQLEAWRQRRDQQRNRVARIHKAFFALVEQRSYLLNLKRQNLNPHRENPIRAFLPPVLALPTVLNIERTELTFLLAAKESEC